MNLKILKYNLYLMGVLSGLIWALGGDKKIVEEAEVANREAISRPASESSRAIAGELEDPQLVDNQGQENTVEGSKNNSKIIREKKEKEKKGFLTNSDKKESEKEKKFIANFNQNKNSASSSATNSVKSSTAVSDSSKTIRFSGGGLPMFARPVAPLVAKPVVKPLKSNGGTATKPVVATTPTTPDPATDPEPTPDPTPEPEVVVPVEISLINILEELHSYRANAISFSLSKEGSSCSDVSLTFDSNIFAQNEFSMQQTDLVCTLNISMTKNVASSSYLIVSTPDDSKTIALNIIGVDEINIIKEIPAKIPKGLPFQVSLEATLSNGEKLTPTEGVVWTVNDKLIKNSDWLLADAVGLGQITAEYQFLTATSPVDILAISRVYLSSYLIDLPMNVDFNVDMTAVLSDNSHFKLSDYATYTALDSNLTVDEDVQVITTRNEGVGELNISFDTFSAKSVVKINNKQLDFMRIFANDVTGLGLKDKVKMELVYQDASTQDISNLVSILSEAPEVLVYAKPEVTGLSLGQSILSASFNNDTAEKTVEVQELTLTDIDLEEKNMLAYKNQAIKLNAKGKYLSNFYPLSTATFSAPANSAYTLVNGVLTILNPTNVYGELIVTVTSGSVARNFTIFYSPVSLTGYDIVAPSLMKKYTQHDLKVIATLSDGGALDVTKKSTLSIDNLTRAQIENTTLISMDLGAVVVSAVVESQTVTKTVNIVDTETVVSGIGLFAEYFNGRTLTTKKGERIDSQVNFNWANNIPASMGLLESYSIRWTGSYIPSSTETIIFCLDSDDGARMYANNQLVINNWTDHALARNCSGNISAVRGQKIPVRIEYYENGGFSEIRLYKGTNTGNVQIVPKANLLPY